ncbi:beta-amyrin 24-hydroxylase [Glycine max]|uniref:beta-amyrin 24-hydroxylase n=1 Tax=Glycine max TaxID=3847 RepID=UPI0003DEB9E3|nr:beta-amyrin 24-hydroxylase-like [Glycine max]|eukprot:XP_006577682.1 beta-amyrin 24-hydroxylase-like [Glycine max]
MDAAVPYHTKHKQPSPPALFNGPYWRFIKKLCMTQLLSSSQVAHFVHVREQEINSLLKNVMVCSNEGRVMDLSFELTALTNNILCRMAMSTSCLDRVDDAAEVLGLVREFLGKFDYFGYGKKLVRIVDKFDKVLERILEEHEVKNTGHDGYSVSRYFPSGLQWAMAEIMNNPGVFEKVKPEINTVVGTNRLVNESDIPNLRYLQAVVKEVLRLHPTAERGFNLIKDSGKET